MAAWLVSVGGGSAGGSATVGRPIRAPDARAGGSVRGEHGGGQREACVPCDDHPVGRGRVVTVVLAMDPAA